MRLKQKNGSSLKKGDDHLKMSLLDIVGLGSDKQAVIFDIGEAYTKIGFAGESTPRHIIPSRVRRLVGDKLEEVNIVHADDLYETLREFLHAIYFKYLLVNPRERRVVICESLLCSIKFRNTLAKVLFGYFDVVSVLFAPNHLLSLFTLGVPSALVVDCGYAETLVVPIYEYTPILSAVESFPTAGRALHKHLEEQILSTCGLTVKEDVIENIKVTTCFVGRHGEAHDHLPSSVDYVIENGENIVVDGKLRAHTFDAMFDGDDEGKSISSIILDSLARCPLDCRRTLSENVVLIGGTTMTPGFEARVLAETKDLLSNGSYSKKLAFKNIKLRRPPVHANYVAWLGGAIYGTLETLSEHSISREKYRENPRLPDWASLLSYTNNQAEKTSSNQRSKLSSYHKTITTPRALKH